MENLLLAVQTFCMAILVIATVAFIFSEPIPKRRRPKKLQWCDHCKKYREVK